MLIVINIYILCQLNSKNETKSKYKIEEKLASYSYDSFQYNDGMYVGNGLHRKSKGFNEINYNKIIYFWAIHFVCSGICSIA